MSAFRRISRRPRRSARLVLLTLAVALLLAGVSDEPTVKVSAQDAGSGPRLKRIAHLGGQSKAVAAQDDVVLLGMGPRVEVHRLDGAGQPTLLSAVPFDRAVVDIAWTATHRTGTHAFVLTEDGMLTALDIAVASAPIVLGAWTVPSDVAGTVDRIVRQDDTLVASGDGGLVVADVSDPAALRWEGDLAFDEPIVDVALALPQLHVLTHFAELHALDLTDRSAPTRTGMVALDGELLGKSIALRGSLAYVFSWGPAQNTVAGVLHGTHDAIDILALLSVVDIAEPSVPREVGRVDLSDRVDVGVEDLLWHGDRLFGLITDLCLHCVWGGLIEFDVSDPTDPRPSPVMEIGRGRSSELAAAGGHLVSAQLDGGMRVLDALDGGSTGGPATVVASRTAPIDPHTIAVNERHVVFGDGRHIGESGLGIIQRGSDPLLRMGSTLVESSLCAGTCEVAIHDDRAFFADVNEHFVVVDLALNEGPRIVQRVELSGRPDQIAVTDRLALALVDHPQDGPGSRLEVIDISDARQARHVGSYAPVPGAADVAVHRSTSSGRDYAVVAGAQGMHIIDLEDPTRPRLAGSADVALQGPNLRPPYRTVATHGDHAYFVNSLGTIVVADLRDPSTPQIVGSRIDPGRDRDAIVNVAAAAVTGDVLYSLTNDHIDAYDLRDPGRPYQVVSVPGASVGMPGLLRDVAVYDGELYVSGDRAGIGVFELVRPPLQYRVHLPMASNGR